jgi:hypothetical protein
VFVGVKQLRSHCCVPRCLKLQINIQYGDRIADRMHLVYLLAAGPSVWPEMHIM